MVVSEGFPSADAPPGESALRLDDMQCATEVRLLVVDDDAATCQVIEAALAHKDLSITLVNNPNAVEAALKGNTAYHLVILDYVLPGLTTETVLGWLQEHQATASLIVVTGYPSMESALNCLRARAFDYLAKPFQIAHLRQTVLRCLHAKGLLRLTEAALCAAVGNAIRERRRAAELTLVELARRAGVSVGYLSQIELGRSAASIEKLYRICLGLRIRLTELFETFPQ